MGVDRCHASRCWASSVRAACNGGDGCGDGFGRVNCRTDG